MIDIKSYLKYTGRREDEMKKLTPLKAIRKKCLDCCCGQAQEVRLCDVKTCTLHPYRMGKRPKDDKSITDDEKIEKTEATKGF